MAPPKFRGYGLIGVFKVGHLELGPRNGGSQHKVLQNGHAFQFAAQQLKGDRNFVLKVLQAKPSALEHVAEELKGDREVPPAISGHILFIFCCVFGAKK